MFYTDGKLQYPVKVDKPNPVFARALQQAIGGIEGEIRVCLQYLFQSWGARGPTKYREMLLNTGTEEIGHIEMLSTAVALNLEKAPLSMQEDAASDGVAGAVLNGMNLRHILSAGLSAMPVDSSGVPFDCSHIYASGNIAADMFANVTAESTGRAGSRARRGSRRSSWRGSGTRSGSLSARTRSERSRSVTTSFRRSAFARRRSSTSRARAAGGRSSTCRRCSTKCARRRGTSWGSTSR